jgi:hypothetical protein
MHAVRSAVPCGAENRTANLDRREYGPANEPEDEKAAKAQYDLCCLIDDILLVVKML